MTLPQLAEITELERWLGRGTFSQDEYIRADTVLEKVSALIRHKAGATWVDEDGNLADVPGNVPGLAVTVAARIWDNPTFRTQSTTGPFSVSWGPQVGLVLTDEEAASLPITGRVGGLSTISTTRGPIETMSGRERITAQSLLE